MKPDLRALPNSRCYDCFRPQAACFCDSIPRIDNRTQVLIVQHRRERFHPFNTARIVQKALRNSELVFDYTCNLTRQLRVHPRAGLLYPGPAARLISDLTTEELPDQLVILDGTWHQAKTLLRDIPVLRSLPRYQLAPPTPSRYRIRRPPSAAALSTLEAAVAALQILEPQTPGFDRLLQAFDTMVEHQLAHPGSLNGQRYQLRRNRTFKNVPRALLGDLGQIVVAYGEASAGERGCKRAAGPPISWVAQRLGSGETFACKLTPPRSLDDVFLGHLGLTRADFDDALPLDEVRRRWAQFQRPTDVVAVLRPGTARLFSYLAGPSPSCLVLKSVAVMPPDTQPTAAAIPNFGRAGLRLAQAIAFVEQMRALARSCLTQPHVV